jgi:diguanylate cyclase (GGDEF)-like protein
MASAARTRPEPALIKSGVAMHAAAATIGTVETLAPGGPSFSPLPALIALVMVPLLLFVGPRVPRWLLGWFGPLGAALAALTVAGSPGAGDAAILYAWPVLWVACFYGTRMTALTVLVVAVGHAWALITLVDGNFDRWVDVLGSVTVVAGVARGLAARNERLVERLTAESRVDPLTGLLNRRGLEERFDVELSRAVREHRALSVVTLDIDHFKHINDTFGHQAGDRALVWLASTLCEHTRGADIVARAGGEEFVIVLPGAGGEAAVEFAERLREAIAGGAPETPFTVSLGVASALAPSTAHTLLEASDRALYAAKHAGRNRVSSTRS